MTSPRPSRLARKTTHRLEEHISKNQNHQTRDPRDKTVIEKNDSIQPEIQQADIGYTRQSIRRTRRSMVNEDAAAVINLRDSRIVEKPCPEFTQPGNQTIPDEESSIVQRSHEAAPHEETKQALMLIEQKPLPSGGQILSQAISPGEMTDTAINDSCNTGQTVLDNETHSSKSIGPITLKPMDIVIRTRPKPQILSPYEAGQRRRTVIRYLVLTNFKSYAGRQKVGPFHTSFSSVVGPNGSGKSNVIDSLLFVFGFRASKMRQGKVSALIHNSAAYPSLESCEVEVHFQEVSDQGSEKAEVCTDSTLIISRKAFRNNSSKYFINGCESNFTNVTSLLRDRGVDLDHKRFLILQGEVESIAQMRPKATSDYDDGLLEYLEDIIGTSKYKGPIEESMVDLERLNALCLEKKVRVQHVEKEKEGLKEKRDVAISLINVENQLVVKQATLYQIFIAECENNIQVILEAIEEIQSQLEEDIKRNQVSEVNIEDMRKRCAVESEQLESLESVMQTMTRNASRLDKEKVKFEEKKKHFDVKLKKLERALSVNQSALSEASTLVERLQRDLDRNSHSTSELESRLRSEELELSSIRASLQDKTEFLSDQIVAQQHSLEPWIRKLTENRSEIAVAQSKLTILREKCVTETRALADIEAKIACLISDKSTKALERQSLIDRKNAMSNQALKLRQSIGQYARQEPELRLKLLSIRQKADEVRASLAIAQTQGKVLSGLIRLSDSGRISGFYGRLGNLGSIEQKYDGAISTACPALDYIVVENVEVGQQCIEYLRKNNLGRANFMLLNQLDQRDMEKIKTPEDAPRLFDLVKSSDTRFRPAFFSVLQNTLVAKDLEQANRIAYGMKRWRVVTLDGQLIDKSGTMSGGGAKTTKGAMSSRTVHAVSEETMSELEARQDALQKIYGKLQSDVRFEEASLRDIDEALPNLEICLQKCTMELQSIDNKLIDAKHRKEQLTAHDSEPDLELVQIEDLEHHIMDLERDNSKQVDGANVIELAIASLQEKIMQVGGEKLRNQRVKVEDLKSQIRSLSEEWSGAELSKAKAEQQKRKNEKLILENGLELERIREGLKQIDEDAQKQAIDAACAQHEAAAASDVLRATQEALQISKDDLDQMVNALNGARANEIEKRNKLEGDQKILRENEKRLTYWQEKLNSLSLQDIGDLYEGGQRPSLVFYTRDELVDLDRNILKSEIAILEEHMQNIDVDLGVLSEYRRRVDEHASRSQDLADAVALRDVAKKRNEELRRFRLEGFMEGFSIISLRLKEMYQMITMGGNAELELVDSLDPFSEGILFSVMPPKKSWKNISNLSGGEKTLSSLALVFALHHYKPTPLYVMDEIDAALDFRNVSIVATYIKERTRNAQFIVISLRNNMFELASRLIGVYKVNHMTKSVTVENKDYIIRQT